MNKLNNNELDVIDGGATLSGTLINAITGAGKFIYGIGQALGSSIRRIAGGNYCSL